MVLEAVKLASSVYEIAVKLAVFVHKWYVFDGVHIAVEAVVFRIVNKLDDESDPHFYLGEVCCARVLSELDGAVAKPALWVDCIVARRQHVEDVCFCQIRVEVMAVERACIPVVVAR